MGVGEAGGGGAADADNGGGALVCGVDGARESYASR